ncbi:hypothetical protein [Dictyobacter formicarum]|uniref:Uncharacterized protein n=1 Tax=Dictyobacter formicarum TaxID=2778368 RepID=A0ABQ3VWA2_9CHLR|nr:hypothetical protein [Dictyobacter formicarum]GHO89658.1 hypothetical protein KSZ_76640 [Dictyobacter formicarum]
MIFLRLFPRLVYLLRAPLGSCVCLLAALLLISCSSTNPNPVTLRPTPIATAASIAPATVATPAPVSKPLAAPPQNCNTSLPPQHRHLDSLGSNSNVQLLGGGPFWINDGFYQRIFHTAQYGNQQWPGVKMVVEVEPNYDQPVTLRLRNMETGALAWWTDAQSPPVATAQTLVLKPREDKRDVGTVRGLAYVPHGEVDAGWKEWGLFPVFFDRRLLRTGGKLGERLLAEQICRRELT